MGQIAYYTNTPVSYIHDYNDIQYNYVKHGIACLWMTIFSWLQ